MTDLPELPPDPARRPASPLTRVQAQRLTDRIAKAVDGLWELLQEARDKNAWAKLGYASWEQYVKTEFGMSRGQSYRLLDQGRVIGELQEAAGLSRARDTPEVSARQAAAVKPVLEEVVEEVRSRTTGKPRAERKAIVAEVVRETVATPRQPPHTPAPAPQPVAPPSPAPPAPAVEGDPITEAVSLLIATPPKNAVHLSPVKLGALAEWAQRVRQAKPVPGATRR